MLPRSEGEMAKLVRVENGWSVVVWDPEPPKSALPGQAPCAQAPVKWWRTYIFATLAEAVTFVGALLERTND